MNIKVLLIRTIITISNALAIKTVLRLKPTSALEVGCGRGVITKRLRVEGIRADAMDMVPKEPWIIEANAENLTEFESDYDLVISSNLLEHVPNGKAVIRESARVGHRLWLSWTPWWSPHGMHSWPCLHWIGIQKSRQYTVGDNLFRTSVSDVLSWLDEAGMEVITIRPRYYPWLSFLAKWKWTREWATWNIEIYAVRKPDSTLRNGQSKTID